MSDLYLYIYKISVYKDKYDWLLTVFISGYANTVVTSHRISQYYLKKK